MRRPAFKSCCPICGGRKVSGKTTFSVDLGFGVVIVRNVSATICDQCGEEWISPDVARKLEKLVEEARQKKLQVEVMAL
ncbi:MAG: type II toxin-antitoxin system MqsA family antitoxin [Nitrospirae bacterium]|nr:type II toxin-antitoxin system MqsA family antitoxin [Nitrospirota bacterium]